MRVGHEDGTAAFLGELDAFATVAGGLSDLELMAVSRCTGWTVGDVIVHVHLGLQEMLLGVVAPTGRAPDTDASEYWRAFPPTNDDDADQIDGMRFVRLLGAAYRRPTGLVRHLLPTVDGLRRAVGALTPGAVEFQGHVLSTGDFLATWAVELAVHQLDLHREPTAPGLRLARLTIEALVEGDLPAEWPDDQVVLLGTGRVAPDPGSPLAARLPVLG
jgi:uncharacterized protein (TIGR03083 family)